jgi:hypothetical protein
MLGCNPPQRCIVEGERPIVALQDLFSVRARDPVAQSGVDLGCNLEDPTTLLLHSTPVTDVGTQHYQRGVSARREQRRETGTELIVQNGVILHDNSATLRASEKDA